MRTHQRLSLIFLSALLALLASGVIAHAAHAPGDFIIVSNEQVGGRPYRVAVTGTLLYVGQDRIVRALDTTDPAAPVQAGLAYTLPGSIMGLAVDGARLYAATNGEVYIFSCANPGDLQLLGITTAPSAVHDIAALGNVLYVADGAYGVLAVDVTDPALPVLTQTTYIPATANSIDVAGALAVVATEGAGQNRVYALDLADPLHPQLAGSVPIGGPARGVALIGRYAFASAANTTLVNLAVVDVLTPTAPALVTRITLTGTTSQVVAGDGYVYVTAMEDVAATLHVVDVLTPTEPVRAGTLTGLGTGLYAAWQPGTVFIADQTRGRVLSVDVSAPAAPALAGSYGGPGLARAVAWNDRYAAVADYWSGLSVIDLAASLPRTLPEIGRVPVADLNNGVAVSGSLVYLSSSSTGLRIFDLANPSAPALLGAVDMPGAAGGVAVRGTHAYVASGDQGLTVVNIANPAHPAVQGTFTTTEWIYDVAAGPRLDRPGGVVYLAGATRFRIVDVTTPAAPVQLGDWDTAGANLKVAVQDTHLFLANAEFGMLVYDVSNPSRPQPIGVYLWSGASGVAVDGDYAYLTAGDWPWEGPARPATGNSGLRVLDISAPDAPVLLGAYNTPGTPTDVVAAAGTALVADGEGGVARVRAFRVQSTIMLPLALR